MDIISNAGGASSFSFDPSSSPALPSTGRGRVRSADFGLPERSGLLDLARTYLETQARLWPDLVGTAAVPAADAAVSGTLACRTGYTLAKTLVERRDESGVSWFLIDDLSRMSRNTIESLRLGELAAETGVRVIGASDGFDSANPQSSLLLPVLGSMNEAFITQLRSKVKRGMDDAFRRGDNIQPPGVGYRLVDLKDAAGNLVITHKNTIEKVVEIDPEAAEWTRRGAEMIAYEGKSAVDVARLFNEHKVGGKQTWSDSRVRQHFGREKLVGKDVFRKTKQVIDRQTGKKKVIQLPASEWIWREVPHLRILSDELAAAVHQKLGLGAESFGRKAKERRKKVHRVDLYPKVLIRPVCGCCGNPMILGRSVGKYQSFFCFNANNGIRGCTNSSCNVSSVNHRYGAD
jgi:site-specific DNA recombinase